MEEIDKEIESKSIERTKTEIQEVVKEEKPKKTRTEAQKQAFEKARKKQFLGSKNKTCCRTNEW